MKKVLFACSTKYSILNSIRLSQSLINTRSDLLVFPRDESTRSFALELRRIGLFNSIAIGPNIDKSNRYFLGASLLVPGLFIRFFTNLKWTEKYSSVYSQSFTHSLLARELTSQKNFKFIEEGLSSYTGRAYNLKNKNLLIKGIVFYLSEFKKYDLRLELHLNLKEISLSKSALVNSLPSNAEKVLRILRKIQTPGISHNYANYKFIYLGVPFYGLNDLQPSGLDSVKSIDIICERINAIVFETISKSKSIYRKHPLETMTKVPDFIEEDLGNQTWELSCCDLEGSQVLINYFSTAAFTPKLMYDREPSVLFLYKLAGLELLNADNLIDNLRKIYRDKSKIMIPSNNEELMSFLDDC